MPEGDIEKKPAKSPSILETVSFSQQTATLRTFNPQDLRQEYLAVLKPRERQILENRHGLQDGEPQTLESIGKHLNLTRERVRQIEKEALKKLTRAPLPAHLAEAVGLIFGIIEEQGAIIRETKILDTLLASNNTPVARRGILFILNLVPRFMLFPENSEYHQSWYVSGFDQKPLREVIGLAQKALQESEKPIPLGTVLERVKKATTDPEILALSNEALESYIGISKSLGRNAYEEWGLSAWTEIHPKDIGDKIYLVLLHYGKPEHYAKITELINKQSFDQRVANKETVHNELIKDERFVLVGRGIYALKDWGYERGIVADVIRQILQTAKEPLTKAQIIEEVLKRRLVKRNTVIVGLSNKKLFKKTADNRYANV